MYNADVVFKIGGGFCALFFVPFILGVFWGCLGAATLGSSFGMAVLWKNRWILLLSIVLALMQPLGLYLYL